MISTIVFDIGNVLMKFDYNNYIKDLLRDDAIIERVNDAVWRSGLWNKLDLGENADEVFAQMLAEGPGCEKEIRLALENVRNCMFRQAYAIPWITSLKERGYKVLFLSNYSEYIMNAKPEVLDFLPLMDGGIFSCHVHLVKPDPAIYRALIDRDGLTPSDSVFLDDFERNVEAARSCGLHAILFEDHEQAVAALENCLAGGSDA